MTTRKVKANTSTLPALEQALLSIVDPLIKTLDFDIDDTGNHQPPMEARDTGTDRPSQRDMGLRVLIGQICQTLHTQTYGAINTRNGNKLPNAKEHLDASEQRLADMRNRIEDGTLSSQDLTAIHWFKVNEARFEMLNDLLGAFTFIHHTVTGEKWKPYERKAEPEVKVSEEEKVRLLAMLAKAGAKNKAAVVAA